MNDVFFLVVGILLTLVGTLACSADVFARIRCRVKIQGTIESVKVEKVVLRGSPLKYYIPVISYTVDKTYTAAAPLKTSNEEKYKVGDSVGIYYNEKKPDEFYIKEKFVTLFGGLAILIAGVCLIVCYCL